MGQLHLPEKTVRGLSLVLPSVAQMGEGGGTLTIHTSRDYFCNGRLWYFVRKTVLHYLHFNHRPTNVLFRTRTWRPIIIRRAIRPTLSRVRIFSRVIKRHKTAPSTTSPPIARQIPVSSVIAPLQRPFLGPIGVLRERLNSCGCYCR